jgi:glutamyl-tRNA synthetase
LKNDSAVAVLEASRHPLAAVEWKPEAIHGVIEQVAARLELGMSKIAQPLRVAMTGTQVSPSIDHTIYLAGRDEALKRIDHALLLARG